VTPERVAAACGAWLWYPTDATAVVTDRSTLVRWPDYFRAAPALLHLDPAAPVDEVLDEAAAQARAWGVDELLVWVRLDAPPGLESSVRERGGRLDESVDVFALDLVHGLPDLAVPPDVDVRWQVDEATTRDWLQVGIEAFDEGSMPDDARVRELAEEAASDFVAGRTASAVAYLDGRPVAAGGLTLAGETARLWGGGVVPAARGRGAYRAVVDARLRHAVRHGSTMALVKGRVATSGPVLRRAGFEVFGQERSYLLPLA
jgi:hypothetical protein